MFARAHASVRNVAEVVERITGALHTELTNAAAALAVEQQALSASHADEDEAYKTLLLRHESDRGRTTERERLQKECITLGGIAKLSSASAASSARHSDGGAKRDAPRASG